MGYNLVLWRPRGKLLEMVNIISKWDKIGLEAPIQGKLIELGLLWVIREMNKSASKISVLAPNDELARRTFEFFYLNSDLKVSFACGWCNERDWSGDVVVTTFNAILDDDLFSKFDKFLIIHPEAQILYDGFIDHFLRPQNSSFFLLFQHIPKKLGDELEKLNFKTVKPTKIFLREMNLRPCFYAIDTPLNPEYFELYETLKREHEVYKGTRKGSLYQRSYRALSEDGICSLDAINKDLFPEENPVEIPYLEDNPCVSHKIKYLRRILELFNLRSFGVLVRSKECVKRIKSEFSNGELGEKTRITFYSMYDKVDYNSHEAFVSFYFSPKFLKLYKLNLAEVKRGGEEKFFFLLLTPKTVNYQDAKEAYNAIYPARVKRENLGNINDLLSQIGWVSLQQIKRYTDIPTSKALKHLKKLLDEYKVVEVWHVNRVELDRWIAARQLDRDTGRKSQWALNPAKSHFNVFEKVYLNTNLGKKILKWEDLVSSNDYVIEVNEGRLKGTWRELYPKLRGKVYLTYSEEDLIIALDYKIRNKVEAYIALKNFNSIIEKIVRGIRREEMEEVVV
ncbi:MAG: hypothetical protein ACP6IP_08490 [Candidatus Njordarchaeia archaeon]